MRLARGVVGTIAAATALAIAAPAHAAPQWQTFPEFAPGATTGGPDNSNPLVEMTVAGSTPYIALTSRQTHELTVWRLTGPGWQQVGGPLNHTAGSAAGIGGIAADGDTVWVSWTERVGDGPGEIRAARLAGDGWDEVDGGPANTTGTDAFASQLAIHDGRPYIAFRELTDRSSSTHVARVDGDAFERVDAGLSGTASEFFELAVAGGSLYLAHHTGFTQWELARFDDEDTEWDVVEPDFGDGPSDAEGHGGTLHVTRSTGVWRWTDAAGFEQVGDEPFADAEASTLASAGGVLYAGAPGGRLAAFDGTDWQPVPLPSESGEHVDDLTLVSGPDGALWALYFTAEEPVEFPPLDVQVARYGEPPAPPDDDTPGGPPEPGGGFTTPDGRPAPVPSGPKGGRPGACANRMLGTLGPDRIVGTAFGESINARAGDDDVFGRRGSDCLWGGAGFDTVSGGGGSDALSGGSGRDRLVPGPGRDDVAAGRGNDVIVAVGGNVDRVNCGPGFDTVRLSRNDLIKGCERVVVVRR